MLGRLFSIAQSTDDDTRRSASYLQAFRICQHVIRQVVGSDGRLLLHVPVHEIHRLQRVYLTIATLHAMTGPNAIREAIGYHFRTIELGIRPPSPYSNTECYTMRDLLLSVCVAGYMLSSSSSVPIPAEIIGSLSIDGYPPFLDRIMQPPFDLFRTVHDSAERLLNALLSLGGGVLPTLLLLPEQLVRLPMVLFPFSVGVLPAICTRNSQTGSWEIPPESTRQNTNLMMSTILLTVAKQLQDESLAHTVLPGIEGTMKVSTSLITLLYYLALSLSPSPSTYNNLGILLCTLSSARPVRNIQGQKQLLDGPTLARLYYQAGLQLEPTHPHILTNLGSLLKDQGHVDEAIECVPMAFIRPSIVDPTPVIAKVVHEGSPAQARL